MEEVSRHGEILSETLLGWHEAYCYLFDSALHSYSATIYVVFQSSIN